VGQELEKAAIVIAQAARLNAEVAAMQAENQMRAHRNEAPAYTEKQFQDIIAFYTLTETGNASRFIFG